jgi:hypothetical protein
MTEIRQDGSEMTATDRRRYLRCLRAKLIMAGKRINDVGNDTGYHPSYVTHVLAGRRNNKRIVDYIERLA